MWLCLTFVKVWCNIICVESAIKTPAYLTYLPVTSYAVSVITERRRICEVWWAAASTAGEVDWKSTAVRDSRLHNTWRPADRWTMDSWSWCHNRHHAPWTTCCRVSLVSSHSRVISVPVCLSVHEHVSGTCVRSSPNFLCISPIIVAQSSSGGMLLLLLLMVVVLVVLLLQPFNGLFSRITCLVGR